MSDLKDVMETMFILIVILIACPVMLIWLKRKNKRNRQHTKRM
ncbi:hypothetical protein QPK24_07995 [Paenibacillus polygoni]|uniref:PEP-CTERM protein-sorting domain-containing protein n=1 Tax=Paenibacillus polygoni TaxID=3050112 RepID=A0ABY8X6E6_9BACL|nr:hypothetical protein [Paenibacillus polygoni]WIV20613.1 hypothetical protein QPK24_07995 [Paenibacillus polygoni]